MLFAWMLQSRKFILFGESDGVIPNEYLAKPRLVSGKGEVYMGGVNGLLCIDNRFPATSSNYPDTKGPSDAQETAEHQKMQGQRDYCIPIWHK